MATIRDIAKAAGVAPSTASRVLNGLPFVSDEIRERVLSVMKEMDYRPNLHARRLNNKDVDTIAFVLSRREAKHDIHGRTFIGVADACAEHEMQALFVALRHDYGDEAGSARYLPRVLERTAAIAGAVLGGITLPNLPQALAAQDTPHVMTGGLSLTSQLPAKTKIAAVDDIEAFVHAANHLISLGHKRILFAGEEGEAWWLPRYLGYCRAMKEAGLKARSPMNMPSIGITMEEMFMVGPGKLPGSINPESVRRKMAVVAETFIDQPERPTAVVCSSEGKGIGLILSLQAYGIRVPEDVSVIGFDGTGFAFLSSPALTSMCVPWELMGGVAVRLLLPEGHPDRIEDNKVVLRAELAERESVAPL